VIVLVIPVVALLLALTWVRWMRQPEKPLDPAAQIAAHHRTLDALAPDAGTGPTTRSEDRPRSRMPISR
jgi:hypothetical protein